MAIITKDSEKKLFEKLKEVEDYKDNLYGIHFRLSKLQERNSSEFQIKIGINVVSDLLKKNDNLFLLKNNDVVVLFETTNRDLLDKLVYQLRYLFADDPLAFSKGHVENPNFCSVYILKFQWREFSNLCVARIKDEKETTNKQKTEYEKPEEPGQIIDHLMASYNFSRIDNDFKELDLNHLIRNQAVCAVVSENEVKKIFNEVFVSIPHLSQVLNYDDMFVENKLLFRYLTEKLDEKFISFLKDRLNRYNNSTININLNMKTIISDGFLELQDALEKNGCTAPVIDINVSDVFLDMHIFHYVKQYLKSLGYKICLDGVDYYSFTQINREKLGFDLIKLRWNPDLNDDIEFAKLAKAVKEHGAKRVILSNCDEPESVEFGRSLGINLFQGWHFDRVSSQKEMASL